MHARPSLDPNLGFYRKSAKELKRALLARDRTAATRFVAHHPRFAQLAADELLGRDVPLGDAQLVVAREQGFTSWAAFKAAVEGTLSAPKVSTSDALIAAIETSDLPTVKRLCASQPGLASQPDASGTLPLVEACERGLLEIAGVLLDAGADPRIGHPLLRAAHAGPHKRGPALAVAQLLIERGAPNDVFTHALLGRVDELRRALPNVQLEARGPDDSTALFLAAWNGHVDAVQLLLVAGADPNPTGRGGQSLWQCLMLHLWSSPHREIARLLLERGVPCSFAEACALSHLASVERMLKDTPELKDEPDSGGVSPLMRAVLDANVPLAHMLLAAGAEDPRGQGRALVTAAARERESHAGALYRNCSFKGANFHDCNLEHATFSDVNLSGARIDNANLAGVHIDRAAITGMTIYGIEIEPLLVKVLQRRAARRARPKGPPTYRVARAELEGGIVLAKLATAAGLAASLSEVRRLAQGGGLRVNDRRESSANRKLTMDDLVDGVIKLTAGKKKIVLVRPVVPPASADAPKAP